MTASAFAHASHHRHHPDVNTHHLQSSIDSLFNELMDQDPNNAAIHYNNYPNNDDSSAGYGHMGYQQQQHQQHFLQNQGNDGNIATSRDFVDELYGGDSGFQQRQQAESAISSIHPLQEQQQQNSNFSTMSQQQEHAILPSSPEMPSTSTRDSENDDHAPHNRNDIMSDTDEQTEYDRYHREMMQRKLNGEGASEEMPHGSTTGWATSASVNPMDPHTASVARQHSNDNHHASLQRHHIPRPHSAHHGSREKKSSILLRSQESLMLDLGILKNRRESGSSSRPQSGKRARSVSRSRDSFQKSARSSSSRSIKRPRSALQRRSNNRSTLSSRLSHSQSARFSLSSRSKPVREHNPIDNPMYSSFGGDMSPTLRQIYEQAQKRKKDPRTPDYLRVSMNIPVRQAAKIKVKANEKKKAQNQKDLSNSRRKQRKQNQEIEGDVVRSYASTARSVNIGGSFGKEDRSKHMFWRTWGSNPTPAPNNYDVFRADRVIEKTGHGDVFFGTEKKCEWDGYSLSQSKHIPGPQYFPHYSQVYGKVKTAVIRDPIPVRTIERSSKDQIDYLRESFPNTNRPRSAPKKRSNSVMNPYDSSQLRISEVYGVIPDLMSSRANRRRRKGSSKRGPKKRKAG